ncbi:MAG: hypothetical protein R2747_08345 [Pyrinomonadaceae bacterium]
MSRFIFATFFFLATALLLSSCNQDRAADSKIWNETATKGFLTISELRQKHPATGIYETEGFIVDTSKCKCPPGAMCKCAPDSITVAEGDKIPEKEKSIRILTDPDNFRRQRKYGFKIKIADDESADEPNEVFFLMAYQPK